MIVHNDHNVPGGFGMTVSSFAMNDTRGRHMCDYCGNPYNPVHVHDCYEKRIAMTTPDFSGFGGIEIPSPIPPPEQPIRVAYKEGSTSVNAHIEISGRLTENGREIVSRVLPEALALFLNKNKDYGGDIGEAFKLGAKGQFVDIWRKVGKLKRCLWDGEPLRGEQPKEIVQDFFGHCLLILADFERELQ